VKNVATTFWNVVALLAVIALDSRSAHAIPLVFDCVGGVKSANCAVGEAQFEVEIVEFAPDQVAFIFSNDGPSQSAIARIYIADERGTLAGPPEIHQDAPAVIFGNGVRPRNLPGGAGLDPAFGASAELSVMAMNPVRKRGVNPGEHVGLVYPLSPGNTFADVLADLTIGNLRFGLHVVGFASAGNESFVSELLLTETLE
jgi:hypothetical protein